MNSKLVFSHQILLFLQTIRRYFDHGQPDENKRCGFGIVKWRCQGISTYWRYRGIGIEWLSHHFDCRLFDGSTHRHLVKGNRIIEAIMDFVPDIAIEELPIPYCAVATDWKSGQEVVFNEGSLFEAIRASISLPTFYEPVQRDDMILIDGGVVNPIPLNRVQRHQGDILVGVDVSGHDYKAQWEKMHRLTEKQKLNKSWKAQILDKLIPDNLEFNYYTVLSRTISLMIRQNSLMMTQLMSPNILVDIQMSRYGSFDYDKSEKIITLGRRKASQAITEYESGAKV